MLILLFSIVRNVISASSVQSSKHILKIWKLSKIKNFSNVWKNLKFFQQSQIWFFWKSEIFPKIWQFSVNLKCFPQICKKLSKSVIKNCHQCLNGHRSLVGVERNRNQVFVPERDILFPYFKFRFRLSRYRISGRKKAGKFVILWIYFRESLSLSE